MSAPTLKQCLVALAGLTRSNPAMGVRKVDAWLLKMEQSPESTWTPRQKHYIHDLTSKYVKQLAFCGIDFAAVPVPPDPSQFVKPAAPPQPQRAQEMVAEINKPAPTTEVIKRAQVALQMRTCGMLANHKFFLRFPESSETWIDDRVKKLIPYQYRHRNKAANQWEISLEKSEGWVVVDFKNFLAQERFVLDGSVIADLGVLIAKARDIEAKRDEAHKKSFHTDAHLEIDGFEVEKLRGFQKAGVVYAAEKKRCFIADEMGLGKSIQALAVLEHQKSYPAIIVCKAALRLNWMNEIRKWLPRRNATINPLDVRYYVPDVMVISYEGMVKHYPMLEEHDWKAVVLDESQCFPAGTLVKTPDGYSKIESLRPGDKVMSAFGTDVVTESISREAFSVVRIVTELDEFFCTPNHPVFTNKGWVSAIGLRSDHLILNYEETMRLVWGPNEGNSVSHKILREELFREMADDSAGSPGKGIQQGGFRKAFEVHDGDDKKQSRFLRQRIQKDESQESYGKPADQEEDERHIAGDELGAGCSWRKRMPANKRREHFDEMDSIAIVELCRNTGPTWWCRVSKSLQARFGFAGTEVGRRGGWIQSLLAKASGCKEGLEVKGTRVVGVEIFKLSNRGRDGYGRRGDTVYNIEVKNHPSYFVTGSDFLVHNCIKNSKSKRTTACQDIAKVSKAEIRLCLTGTPIDNAPYEFYPQIKFLDQMEALGGRDHFYHYYCEGHSRGANHLKELHEKLRRTCYIRREKKDVLLELPEKQRSIQVLEIDNAHEYERAEKDFVNWLKGHVRNNPHAFEGAEDDDSIEAKEAVAVGKAGSAEKLVQLNHLKRLAMQGMLENAKAWIEDFVESGQKLIVFCHHIEAQQQVYGLFKDIAVWTRASAGPQAAVQAFQQDPNVKIIVCSLMADNAGHTLTASSNVVFLELGWTPTIHDQATDRAHRIGQRDSVTAWYLVAKGTVYERIINLIESKRAVVEAATSGKDSRKSGSVIGDLLKQMAA